MNKIVTIGVYGFNEESFFAALQRAGVDTLCDIRRRRGVRGSEYAFANRARLEARLATLGIRYVHRLDLAPSNELRQGQYAADAAEHVSKRQREALSPAFIEGYQRECLAAFDSHQFTANLGEAARIVAFLCVETAPAACHRSLIAARLALDLGLDIEHLLPGGYA
ncbi:MAG TPA: hypothetical protein DCL15_23600 [Chloroflexi bacterium]|nr:hypothetical protein [Chloroflexota bacterium]HHW85224.1 DUF488 domain-containing protein [Chloroflexota bacterium]